MSDDAKLMWLGYEIDLEGVTVGVAWSILDDTGTVLESGRSTDKAAAMLAAKVAALRRIMASQIRAEGMVVMIDMLLNDMGTGR